MFALCFVFQKWPAAVSQAPDCHAILFLVSTSEFDQRCYEDSETNRLKESISQFRQVMSNENLKHMNVIVVLNKIDVLKSKICKDDDGWKRLTAAFPEYSGGSDFNLALQFIKQQFVNVVNMPECHRHGDNVLVDFIEVSMLNRGDIRRLLDFIINEPLMKKKKQQQHNDGGEQEQQQRIEIPMHDEEVLDDGGGDDNTDSDPNDERMVLDSSNVS